MLASNGYKVGLIGGKADKEICSEIINSTKHDINDYSGAERITETLEYINKAIVVISNDSAAMHIAAARNKPVITIFGSTVREFGFEPYKVPHKLIEVAELSCRPCTHIGRAECPKKHFKCMKEIEPEEVYKSALKLINSRR